MKRGHAAALALVGWYLMVPPIHPNFQFDEHAPLSEWTISSSFDSASGCEQARQLVIDSNLKHEVENLSVATQDGNARLYFLSKCIATDDPRLYGN